MSAQDWAPHKTKILKLRSEGQSYKKIADILNLEGGEHLCVSVRQVSTAIARCRIQNGNVEIGGTLEAAILGSTPGESPKCFKEGTTDLERAAAAALVEISHDQDKNEKKRKGD
ncbi:hypothetical protein V501_09381 [Pseudogymnoascus sp. VKM F-4519 (FW-2642)]|nr:hypothetical protein V501_09381 [Pseudogymnoascus sp. VKM F-4519 (FW-2642)]